MEANKTEIKPRTNKRYIYVMIALVFFVGLFSYRVVLFSETEPSSDQAFFSWWVQGLAQADHIFPTPRLGEGFIAALERDDKSFLHRLLRPIHGKSITVFTMVPLVLRLMMALLFGDVIAVQTISSIFVGTLIMLSVGLLPLWVLRGNSGQLDVREIDGFSLLAIIFAAGTSYLHYYSPLGNHNFGVLFLVIAVSATQRAICFLEDKSDGKRMMIAVAGLCQLLALYAHWTNLFLLPAATIFTWLFSNNLFRKKVFISGYYFIFLLIVAVPFLVLATNDINHMGNARNHTVWDLIKIAFSSGISDFAMTLERRVVRWFINLTMIFSYMGVILGLLGVTLLAVQKKIYFPLGICVSHFLIAITITLFMGAHYRTDLYILPFFIIGLAYVVHLSFVVVYNYWHHRKDVWLAATGILVIAFTASHFWSQVQKIGAPELVQQQIPEFWASYYQGQSEIRPLAEKIDKTLPENAVILTWGYGMQFFLRNYGIERSNRLVLPSLLTLISRSNDGALPALIKRRDISIPTSAPLYALIDPLVDKVDEEKLRLGIENTLGINGFSVANKVSLELQFNKQLTSFWPRNLVLYRVHIR